MLEKNIHSLIIRLFSGEASPDEKGSIGEWLNQSEENRKMYADLQEIWLKSGVEESTENYNIEEAIKNFRWQVSLDRNYQRKSRFSNVFKYAAIFLLLITVPLFYYFGKNEFNKQDTLTTISCAFGDKSEVLLPDGSTVHLNSGSKLTFNNNYKSGYRKASIEGEAYFEVKKNTKLPFVVEASEIEIEVLGTEFNVKAYPGEQTISTTLAEGSIEIRSKLQKTKIEPNQKVVYERGTNKMKLYNLSNIEPETEWKEGRLVFRNESLEELELKLERWFDVDIVFADEKVKKRRFTGILERESILEAVSYFNYSEHVGYKIKDNEITFFSK